MIIFGHRKGNKMKLKIDRKEKEMIEKTLDKRLPIVEQCVGCDKVDAPDLANSQLFTFCKSYINPSIFWGNGKWCPLCSTLVPARVGMTRDKKYKTQKTWTIEWMPREVAKERGLDLNFSTPSPSNLRKKGGK